jgi:hypothetical protein
VSLTHPIALPRPARASSPFDFGHADELVDLALLDARGSSIAAARRDLDPHPYARHRHRHRFAMPACQPVIEAKPPTIAP